MKNDKQQPEKAEDFYNGIHKYKGDEFPEFIGDKIHVWDDHSNPNAPFYKIQFVDSNEVLDNMDDCDIEFIIAPLSNETNINKIDMSDVPASPANEYYSEQGKRMFDRAKVSNETKVVESIEQKHMTIVDQVRTQVEDHTDHVSDFFIKVAGNFEGKNPHVEVQDFTNSETRLSCLKLHDKTEAFVIEKRTELNHCEYTFIQKIDASQSKNTDAVKVITDRITQLERSNPYETGNKFVAIQELNHILKLIQP